MRQFARMARLLRAGQKACIQPLGGELAVEPLRLVDDALLDRARHPFYDGGRGAEAEFFLACEPASTHSAPTAARTGAVPRGATGRCVGRIAAIIDHRFNEHARQVDPGHELCGSFGFFECVDSPHVARELIGAAAHWLRERGMKRMFGPASPSQAYEYGLLVEGFDCPHRFMQPYHPPYYAPLLEGAGLTKAKDLLSLTGDLDDPAFRRHMDRFVKLTDAMRARCSADLAIRPLNMRRYGEEAEILGGVLNNILQDHFGHSPLSRSEWQSTTRQLRAFVNPDWILLAEQRGKPIGLAMAVADLNEIIARLRWRTGIIEPLEFLLRAWRSKPSCACIVVAGVTRDGGKFAVAPMLLGQLVRNIIAGGVRFIDAHQVLEDNHPILDPILRMGLTPDRRHRIYEMKL